MSERVTLTLPEPPSRKEKFGADWVKCDQPGYRTQRRTVESIVTGRGSTWTEPELSRVQEWYAEHATKPMRLQELADELGRTRQQLSVVARWLGIAQRGRRMPYETRKAQAAKIRQWIAENGHPHGALGMKHTPETIQKLRDRGRALGALGMTYVQRNGMTDKQREAMGAAMRKRLATNTTNVYSRAKRGRREDLGDTFWRSSWEANYARYLNLLLKQGIISKWEFEPETFWFEGIKRGVVSYLPDFRVTRPNGSVYYVEVKGWMDAKSKTKIKRMKKYHPKVELEVVAVKQYREIERKLGGAIPNWETSR